MRYLMLFADGFEDTEAIGTLDVLLRGGDTIDMVSLMKRNEIKTKCGTTVTATLLISDVDYSNYDALIIPGGPASFKLMPEMKEVSEAIKYFAENKVCCAICAAPHLIGKLGYLQDKNYTVHPGFEHDIIGGNYLRSCGVVVDKNIITAKSMYYSLDFGFAIYEYFHGMDKALELKKACQGEK